MNILRLEGINYSSGSDNLCYWERSDLHNRKIKEMLFVMN